MKRYVSLILALTLFFLLAMYAQSESVEDLDSHEVRVVTIELTKLDVNDINLELRWKIKNNTEHDVWICNTVNTRSTFNFEVFLSEDAQTLVMRRRLDVPTSAVWRTGPPYGRYICLRPGEDLPESLSLNLPVQSRFVYADHGRTQVTQNARCLTLEIGFYDQDLPGLVYSILQQAETLISGMGHEADHEADFAITREYFRGLLVRGSVGSLSYFEKVSKDPYSKGEVLIGYSYQALTGEKVLRIEVDGLSIPYEGEIQLTSNAGNKTKDVQSRQMSGPKPGKPNREKTTDRNDTDKS